MNTPGHPNLGSGGRGGGKSRPKYPNSSSGRGGGKVRPNPLDMDDPFMTSDVPSGNGNLFSPVPRKQPSPSCAQSISMSQSRNNKGKSVFSVSSASSVSRSEAENIFDEYEQAPGASMEPLEDDDEAGEDVEDDEDYEDVEDDEPGCVLTLSAPTGEKRVGPYHHTVPQAMNVMHKYRNKAVAGKDPNGRKVGRNLVMWHRPRMMDKLVLHIQYECHLAKIKLPWDKIAHRLHPGASGPAIIQFLNKNRDILVQEGHLIPPNMGKSKAVYDDTIRGYVRDEKQDIPTVVRILPWDENYEDKKESLVVPGLVKGSGRYDRNKANRVEVPKETGRRSRVPQVTKEKMAENRTKRKDGGVRKERSKKRAKSPDSPKVKEEVDPAELDSDDDYDPSATASNKRKAKGASTSRKKARGAAELPTLDDEGEATPTKQIKQARSGGKSTVKSAGSKAMVNLSIETPTKHIPVPASSPRIQQSTEHSAISAIKKNAAANKVKAVTEDTDYKADPVTFDTGEDENQDEGRQIRTNSLLGQATSPFGGSLFDIQSQVRAGQTPPYSTQYFDPQASSVSPIGGNSFANFQPITASHYRSPADLPNFVPYTGSQQRSSYGSASVHYSCGHSGGQPRSTAPPTIDAPAPGSYADRRRSQSSFGAQAMSGSAYTNHSTYGQSPHQPNTMGGFYGFAGTGYVNPASLMYSQYPGSSYTSSNSYSMPSANSSSSVHQAAGLYGLDDSSTDQENLAFDPDNADPDGNDQIE